MLNVMAMIPCLKKKKCYSKIRNSKYNFLFFTKYFPISLNVFSCIFNFFVIDFSRTILNLESIKLSKK